MGKIPTGPQASQAPGVIAGAAGRSQQREQFLGSQQMKQQQLEQQAMAQMEAQQAAAQERAMRAQQFEFQRAKANAELGAKYGKGIRFKADRLGTGGKYEVVDTGEPAEDVEKKQAQANRLKLFQSLAPDWAQQNQEEAMAISSSDITANELASIARKKTDKLRMELEAENYSSKNIAMFWPEFMDASMGGLDQEEAQDFVKDIQTMIKNGRSKAAIRREIMDAKEVRDEDWALRNYGRPDLSPEAQAKANAIYNKTFSTPEALLLAANRRMLGEIFNPTDLKGLRSQLETQEEALSDLMNDRRGQIMKKNDPKGYASKVQEMKDQIAPLKSRVKELENRRNDLMGKLSDANRISSDEELKAALGAQEQEQPVQPTQQAPALTPQQQEGAKPLIENILQYPDEELNKWMSEMEARISAGEPGSELAEYIYHQVVQTKGVQEFGNTGGASPEQYAQELSAMDDIQREAGLARVKSDATGGDIFSKRVLELVGEA